MASEIEFEREHTLGLEGVRQKLTVVEQKLRDKFGVALSWSGNVATVQGKGLGGSLEISATKLTVRLKLGLLMRPLAGQIEDAMARQVDKALV
jgi:putative polyhydroxyalkanoate system protein